MIEYFRKIAPVLIIIVLSLFVFRHYFVSGRVPFPSNLHVSTYEPWKSYPVPEYPNGPPNKAMGFDNLRLFYPLKSAAMDSIAQGIAPLWNPHQFTGNTLLATYESSVFHPLNFLFFLTGKIDAWSIIIVLQPILASLAMYLFLGSLSLSVWARLFGAVSFAFCGFFVMWWEEDYMFTYAALFLPLCLFFIEKYIARQKPTFLIWLSLSLAGSVFSGAFQMTMYVWITTAIWMIYRTRKWIQATAFGISFVIGLLLSAVHLLPALEAYLQSVRAGSDAKYVFDAYLLPLRHLVTAIAPDYFGNPATYNYWGGGFYTERMLWMGIVPLFFILITFLTKPHAKTDHSRFFKYSYIIAVSLGFSLPTSWLILYYLKIPLISSMTPTRIFVLSSFFGSVLASYGLEAYRRGLAKKSIAASSLLLAVGWFVAAAVTGYLYIQDRLDIHLTVALRNLVLPGAVLGMTIATVWISHRFHTFRRWGTAALFGLTVFQIVLFTNKVLYFSERRFVFPQNPVLTELKNRSGYDRFWTYDNGYIEKNFATVYGLYSPEGYDTIMIRRYAEFLTYANTHGTSISPHRADALIQSTDHLDDILKDSYRKRLLQITGVKFIARKVVPDKNETKISPDPAGLPTVWTDGTYSISHFESSYPRVMLMSNVQVETAQVSILKSLFDASFDPAKTVILEGNIPVTPDSEATGSAAITDYSPNTVRVRTKTTGAMMLFLSDAYYPGWNAYIDGNKTDIYRADYAFRAVAVPNGIHEIEFRYEPGSWKLGVLFSGIGLILCVLISLFHPRKLNR